MIHDEEKEMPRKFPNGISPSTFVPIRFFLSSLMYPLCSALRSFSQSVVGHAQIKNRPAPILQQEDENGSWYKLLYG